MKEVYPFIKRVDLVGGELFDVPFENNPLVRVLADMAEVASSTIKVTITTNGQHLSRRWADHLLQYPFIDLVGFSIDSFRSGGLCDHARQRIADRVRRSIENVKLAKAARGLSSPLIKFNMIFGAHTYDGVPEFRANARLLDADQIEFQKLVLMGHPEFFHDNNLFQPQHVDKLITLWRDLAANDFRSNRNEIMSMIVAYLTHLGCLDQAMAANPGVPFLGPTQSGRIRGTGLR